MRTPISAQTKIEEHATAYLRNVIRIITETGLRVYKELAAMKKEQVDIANKVVFIADSKTPIGVAEVPLTDIAVEAFQSQINLAGPGPWLFPSVGNRTGHQTEFKKTWRTTLEVEEVITHTLESMPDHSTHWSSWLMARKTGLSQTAIVRIWHAFGLQLHRVENFKFSKNPQFVEKVRDIVGFYMNPPDHAIVLCVDEKSQVQALNRTQPILPLAPGVPAVNRMITNGTESHPYSRHWIWQAASILAGFEISVIAGAVGGDSLAAGAWIARANKAAQAI